MYKMFACAALAVLSACAANFNVETASTYTVGYSEGGDYETWKRRVERLRAEGKRVVISDGAHCHSGCTMLLSLDDVCVGPNAVLGFHGFTPYQGDPYGPYAIEMTRELATHYNAKLRAWFYSDAAHRRVSTADLKGWQVSMMGYPLCEG